MSTNYCERDPWRGSPSANKNHFNLSPRDDYGTWIPTPNVLLYIDNSNIFESAKKHSGHKKGYRNGIPDVACRIDIGKLIARAVGTRGLLFGKLYGSEPPALDSVWDAIRRKQVHVETFQRSKWTLKEKETDSSLTADAVEDIIMEKDNAGPNRTLILFSGDRDLYRVIEKGLKFNYQVEVWSFKGSINNAVKRLANQDPKNVALSYIDDIFDEITYTKVVWGKQRIPKERSLIISINLLPNTDKKKFLSEFVGKSGDIFKLPMMGKYLDNFKYVLLVPCIKEHYTPQYCPAKAKFDQQATTRTYDYYKHVQPFTHMLEEYYAVLNIKIKIQTFIEFIAGRNSNHKNSIISANRFDALKEAEKSNEDDEGDEDEYEDAENSLRDDESEDFDSNEFFDAHHEVLSDADDEDFVPLVRKEVKPKRQYSDPCYHRFSCARGLECLYKHSDKEREFFKVQPDSKFRYLYKIKPCYRPVCPYKDKPYLCGYAHTLEESRCLCCKQQGSGKHWMDKCPLNTLNRTRN